MYSFVRLAILTGIIVLAFSGFHMQGNQAEESVQNDSIFYFKGRVVNADTWFPVAFTHVINTGRNTATICDTLGYFYLRVRMQDTILFTAIGYSLKQIVINDSLKSLNRMADIFMNEVSYSIEGVMINPLGTYSTFRSRVANLELPPSKYEINPNVMMDINKGTDTLDMVEYPIMSPVTAIYNWLSKEGKQKRRYKELLEKEQFEREIAYKYSPLIVSGITGYAGFELYAFMDYCGFSKNFLQEADRYEIRDAVVEKQKSYEADEEK